MRELDVNLSSVPKRIRHYVPFEVSRIVFARPARRKSTLTPRFSIYSIVERNRVIVTVSQNLDQNFSLLFEYIYMYISICEFFQSKTERYLKYLKLLIKVECVKYLKSGNIFREQN